MPWPVPASGAEARRSERRQRGGLVAGALGTTASRTSITPSARAGRPRPGGNMLGIRPPDEIAMSTTLITIAQARGSVLEGIEPLDPEPVAIDDALGRVLAEDVRATADVPPFPCSAMDGYAILAGDSGRRLTVVGESRAGTPAARQLGEGEAIRVSTGA